MPSDKIVLCAPHLSRQSNSLIHIKRCEIPAFSGAGTHNKGKRLTYLMPSRQPKKDGINFIAIKKEKPKFNPPFSMAAPR